MIMKWSRVLSQIFLLTPQILYLFVFLDTLGQYILHLHLHHQLIHANNLDCLLCLLVQIGNQMKEFYQRRNSHRNLTVVVTGHQVPLYGGVSELGNIKEHLDRVALPLNLTFVVRSRAFILGRLVKSKFYRRIRCSVTLHGNKLGKPLHLKDSCVYK